MITSNVLKFRVLIVLLWIQKSFRQLIEMTSRKVDLCRHCARSLNKNQKIIQQPRPSRYILPATAPFFFSKRCLSIKRPLPRLLEAPDPNSPTSSVLRPVKHDPGLTLGEHGIPVPPSAQSRRGDFTDERSWAETVYRTLSGGMKSDYIKCKYLVGGMANGRYWVGWTWKCQSWYASFQESGVMHNGM